MHTFVKKIIPALALVMLILLGAAATNDDQPVADGTYQVVSAIDADYVWEIADASAADEANLQAGPDQKSKAQQFVFTYHTDGYYTITNVNSGRMIECAGAGYEDGTNIWQHAYDNTAAQRWKLVRAGDGYFVLKCKHNGKAADIEESVAASGQNIQAYQYNASAAQKFRLVAVTEGREQNGSGKMADVKRPAVLLYRGIYFLVAAAAVFIVTAGFRRR